MFIKGLGLKIKAIINYREKVCLFSAFIITALINFLTLKDYNLDLPLQNYDSLNHLVFLRGIIDTGDFSPFHTLSNISQSARFYPNLFHIISFIFVSVFSVSLQCALFITFCIGAFVIWPISITYFVWFCSKKRITVGVILTPILSTVFLAYPLLLLDFGTLFPFGFAYSFLPFGLAFAFDFLQKFLLIKKFTYKNIKDLNIVKTFCLLVLFTLLIVLIQPRAYLTFILILIPFFVHTFIKCEFKKTKIIILASSIFVLLIGVAYAVVKYGMLLLKPSSWPGSLANMNIFEATLNWLGVNVTIWPLYTLNFNVYLFLIVVFSIIVFIIYSKKNRLILFSYILLYLVFICCACSNDVLARIISAPWYKNEQRIIAALPIVLIPIIAFSIDILYVKAKKRVNNARIFIPLLLCLFITLSLAYPAKHQLVTDIYRLQSFQPKYSKQEVELLTKQTAIWQEYSKLDLSINETARLFNKKKRSLFEKVSKTVPQNEAVLADPWSGGSLLYSLYNTKVVFPLFKDNSVDGSKKIALNKFTSGESSQEMCSITIKGAKVRWFLDLGFVWRRSDKSYKLFSRLREIENFNSFIEKSSVDNLYRIKC